MLLKRDSFSLITKSRWFHIIAWLALVLAGVLIMYLRYPFAFSNPNFYGEDGNVIYENIYNNGILNSLFARFNGYFIFLQYVFGYLAYILNYIFGGELYTLPKATALVSYLVFSVACTLPWLLFRKKIGSIISLAVVVLLFFTPLGRSDFAVIGTLGNLKFLIFYVAFLLIIYRNDKKSVVESSKKIVLIDVLLLMCAFTNILVIALLPLTLVRYKDSLQKMIRSKSIDKSHIERGLISVFTLAGVLLIYGAWMYILGIPKIPGYLDGPLQPIGLVNSIFRASWYGLIYPAYTTLNIGVVVELLVLMFMAIFIKKNRAIYIAVLWAIVVASIGFSINRPGVTEFLKQYTPDGGPGQFFYAGTMIFIFGFAYLIHDKFNKQRLRFKALALFLLIIYFTWAIPFSGQRSKSFALYNNRPTSYQALKQACQTSRDDIVLFKIYPTEGWNMEIEKGIACRGL